MKQTAADRPVHSYQRKAAIVAGGIADHAGHVTVTPIENFDLNRTIFNTLEGSIPRYVIQKRIAKDVLWNAATAASIDRQYTTRTAEKQAPQISAELLRFLKNECNFDVEHADGSFLDHLFFCYEYTYFYYPGRSALVMLLHSILGTGTNTFAMAKEKIPQLKPLMNDFEWRHVEAFPSVLRLLYDMKLVKDLKENRGRIDSLKKIHFRRVIDNAPITMAAEDFWIQLNYHLIHLTDFIPVSNWSAHYADSSFILFRQLYAFLRDNAKLEAQVGYRPPGLFTTPKGERLGLGGWLLTLLPSELGEWLTAQSVRKFSAQIGHSLEYQLEF